MKKILFFLVLLPVCSFAQTTTTPDTVKPVKPFCIKAFQLALQAKGFYKGKPSGKFDEETKYAMTLFMKREGLPIHCTGNIDALKKAVDYAKYEPLCGL